MNIETEEQLAEYRTVQNWLKGVHHQSPASTTTDADRLSTLLKFCHLAEKDPDMIIAECFRAPKEGDEWKHIKFKTRRNYSALIDQAQAELFGGGTAGRQRGSIIRSFFIHNGVSMQAEPLR
jgi:hypothetical protein